MLSTYGKTENISSEKKKSIETRVNLKMKYVFF